MAKSMSKQWFKSRTVWVGIVEFLIGVATVLAAWLQAGDFSVAGVGLLVIGVLTVVLRWLTDKPIAFGKKTN